MENNIGSDSSGNTRNLCELRQQVINRYGFIFIFRKEGPYSHDIALVKLVDRVVPSTTVSPICLHSENSLQQGDEGVATGWGKTLASSSHLSSCLRAARLPYWEQRDCEEAFKYSSQRILPEMMCAGHPGVDSCDGDSGGPLAGFIDGNYRLVGIISWGFGCGRVRLREVREGGGNINISFSRKLQGSTPGSSLTSSGSGRR